ncbi:hypothetical protein [Streptomyces sp. NPDC055085]
MPDAGGLVTRDYQLYLGEDPVLIDGHTVGLGSRGLYITIELGPRAGMYRLRAGSNDWVQLREVCWQAGGGGGGMQGRLVARGTNTPVEQGERIPPATATAPAASQPPAIPTAPPQASPMSVPGPSGSGEAELKKVKPRRKEEKQVADADSLRQSGRAAERYVVAHGEQGTESTFIPGDLRVQFYSEEGERVLRVAPVFQHLDVKIPTPSIKEPGAKINNYSLEANTREEWGEYFPLLQVLPESEVLYLGNGPLPAKMQLCSKPDKCEEYRLSERAAQEEDGVERVARHRGKCTGLFGPIHAQFLGEVVHLLICRGPADTDTDTDDDTDTDADTADEIYPAHVAAIVEICDSVIREKLGIAKAKPISSERRERFWKDLTLRDIDAMTPEQRTAILMCSRPTVAEYWARERGDVIGSGADPAKMKIAVTALTVAASKAKVAAESYQGISDQVAKDCAMWLLKAAEFTLIAAGIVQGKIEAYERTIEVKEPIAGPPAAPAGRPRGPGGKPEEKVPGGQPDPLTGFSLSRPTLSQVLEMGRMVEKQIPQPPKEILQEWSSFTEATKRFLANPDIGRVSGKDTLRDVGGL